MNVSDRSIASETPSADPWDAILVDTEDSEEDATEDTILPIRKQVSKYLKEKRIPLKSDPLSDYWAMKKDRFDIISPLVSKYLSAPPALTSVERLFSVAGNTVNTKRLSLKPENLESNIFLNYNLRALCVASKEDAKAGGDRVPSCRHRAGGVGQFLAGMQFSTWVLKCVVIC